jgi:hypothetical protein
MHPKGRGPEFANEKRGPAERAVTGIRIGRLVVSAYVPFHVRALHLSAYMARVKPTRRAFTTVLEMWGRWSSPNFNWPRRTHCKAVLFIETLGPLPVA